MSESKIIVKEIYKHRNGSIIVKFEFPETGYRGNMNFNPAAFEGLTQDEIEKEINRSLVTHYESKTKAEKDGNLRSIVDALAVKMNGKEVKLTKEAPLL